MNDELLKDAIDACRDADGVVTPDAVIAAARDADSPLHEFFEWDESKAAYASWVYTARSLIRKVRVVVTNETLTFKVPAFVRNPDAEPRDQGYVAIASLRSDADRAREVIVREFALAAGALQRARSIAAYLDMTQDIEAVQLEVQRLTRAVEASAH